MAWVGRAAAFLRRHRNKASATGLVLVAADSVHNAFLIRRLYRTRCTVSDRAACSSRPAQPRPRPPAGVAG